MEVPADLAPTEELPEGVEHIWTWFVELSGARASTGFGIAPITFQDIAAWSSLTGEEPEPWEVRLLLMLDVKFRDVMSRKKK